MILDAATSRPGVDLDGDGLIEIDMTRSGFLDVDFNNDGKPDDVIPDQNGDGIPEIDLSKKLTNENDFTGKGAAGGRSNGVVGGVAPVNPDQPLFEFQVEKPVVQAPNSAQPRYPDILKSAGVEGEVLAQFVVDTTGRAEVNTYKVLKASHELFASAVRNALPNMKFLPAEVGGRKVKQLVQQPFVFAIQK